MMPKPLAGQLLPWRLRMGSKVAALHFTTVMLIAVSVFAQDPRTKPDKASSAAPVAQAPKPHRIRVKEDVQKAKLVHMVSPVYPAISEVPCVDGTVVLHVIIGEDGAVNSARHVAGRACLRDSAINAVLQWRYRPTLVKGVPVEVDTRVSIVFLPPEKVRSPLANK